jgi:DNA-binding transcriptional MerR regulator
MTRMPHVVARSHLSIGEVLSLLQEEFPDITISKIRFLESQGLLDPERTPSGYRKFYDPDLERLRWILHQQRENFLPLKVIKDRLAESDRRGIPIEDLERTQPAGGAGAAPVDDTVPLTTRPAHAPKSEPAAAVDAPMTSVSLTRPELASTIGITEDDVVDLERFGIITGRSVGKETYFDGHDVVVARAAAGFLKYGVEARHLRMFKTAAEREAGFIEQIVMPLAKQRTPGSRERAVETAADLARHGERLRAALLRHLLGSVAPPPG